MADIPPGGDGVEGDGEIVGVGVGAVVGGGEVVGAIVGVTTGAGEGASPTSSAVSSDDGQ